MKQTADHYFRKIENTITLPEDTIRNNQMTPLERMRSREEKKVSKTPEEKKNKREHLTATYWG